METILLANLVISALMGVERVMKAFQIPFDLSHISKIACSSGCCSAEVLRRSSNSISIPVPKTPPSRAPSYILTPQSLVHPSDIRQMSNPPPVCRSMSFEDEQPSETRRMSIEDLVDAFAPTVHVKH